MKSKIMTGVYSAAHFFVDLACAFVVFRGIYSSGADRELLLIYNFCAFALQMPIGVLLDRFGRGHLAAGSGCMLTALAYIICRLPLGAARLFAAISAGVGNALFHAGGGVYVLDEHKDSGALGVFVSPGAIGLFLGTVWGKGDSVPEAIPVIMMIVFGVLILTLPAALKTGFSMGKPADTPLSFELTGKTALAAALLFMVVVIRSMGGFMVFLPWKAGAAAAAVICTAGGKALGGFASDKLGKLNAAVISMTAAAVLYMLSDNMLCGLGAILFFNMSMPMTLRAAADIFKGGRGFSFGLLTFALFIGYLPPYATGGRVMISGLEMAALCLVSAAMLASGLILSRKEENR